MRCVRIHILVAVMLLLSMATPYVGVTVSVGSAKGTTLSDLRVYRIPEEVKAYEPIIVVLKGCDKLYKLEARISIEASLSKSVPRITLPGPRDFEVTIPFVPLSLGSSRELVCIAALPGLPALKKEITVRGPLGKSIAIEVEIRSKVEIKVVAGSTVVYSDSFTVESATLETDLRPLVFVVHQDLVTKPFNEALTVLKETGGLAPRGYAWPSGTPSRIFVIALDRESEPRPTLLYSVSEASWRELGVEEYGPVMDSINSLLNSINEFLTNVENAVKKVYSDFKVPRVVKNYVVGYADIPPQNPGTYVVYYAVAEDSAGHRSETPLSMYYVYNKGSDTRILIVDPHVELWLLKENFEKLTKYFETLIENELPEDLVSDVEQYKALAHKLSEVDVVKFHHWEYLSKHYRVYIIRPVDRAVELLNELKPNVIILSNLWLGVNASRSRFLDWDLRDVHYRDTVVLAKIIDYVKKSHAGVIATHGSLSDVVVAKCSKGVTKVYKIGTLGHVGTNIEDANPLNERTIASLVGLYILPITENLKFMVAESICKASAEQQEPTSTALASVATLVGSTPLQIPYVPFSGAFMVTEEGKALGWNIPEEFTIEIPGLHQKAR